MDNRLTVVSVLLPNHDDDYAAISLRMNLDGFERYIKTAFVRVHSSQYHHREACKKEKVPFSKKCN
jgi:hypothetical protein